jgi:hypothetical protein
VDWPTLFGHNWLTEVNRVAEKVEDATEGATANWNGDRTSGVYNLDTTGKPVGGVHGYRADTVIAKVLLDLTYERLVAFTMDRDGRVDGGQAVWEDCLDNDALDLLDPAGVVLSGCGHCVLVLLCFAALTVDVLLGDGV